MARPALRIVRRSSGTRDASARGAWRLRCNGDVRKQRRRWKARGWGHHLAGRIRAAGYDVGRQLSAIL